MEFPLRFRLISFDPFKPKTPNRNKVHPQVRPREIGGNPGLSTPESNNHFEFLTNMFIARIRFFINDSSAKLDGPLGTAKFSPEF